MALQIFSDESGCGSDRFEAIGTLSADEAVIKVLRNELSSILERYKLTHCEYKKISGGNAKLCAMAMLTVLHKYVSTGNTKVMVLVWDKYDRRHNVVNRDDVTNLGIMYYRALKTTKRQWRDVTIDSNFYHDELTKVNFEQIQGYIERTKIRDHSIIRTIFGTEFAQSYPTIVDREEKVSSEEPLIQLIDIVTGLVRISYEEASHYQQWMSERSGQLNMFSDVPVSTISKRQTQKFELIEHMDLMFKGDKLSIALKSSEGFCSRKPSVGYFFWLYVPQHHNDHAPSRA